MTEKQRQQSKAGPYPRVWISACLLGQQVTWDGGHRLQLHPALDGWRQADCLLPFCPECAGGLPVPRPAAEIRGGTGADVLAGRARVMTRDGQDVTTAFVQGAQAALQAAMAAGVMLAVLKSRSPSCGSGAVYDGHFQRQLRAGDGVTVALFRQHGIAVFSEQELDQAWSCWQSLVSG